MMKGFNLFPESWLTTKNDDSPQLVHDRFLNYLEVNQNPDPVT